MREFTERDCKIQTFNSGRSSAWVYNQPSGIKVKHKPTGVKVSVDVGQPHRSRAIAMGMIELAVNVINGEPHEEAS